MIYITKNCAVASIDGPTHLSLREGLREGHGLPWKVPQMGSVANFVHTFPVR